MAALNLWKHFWGFNWALQWFWLSICVIIVMRNPNWDQPLQIPPTLIVKGKEFAAHIDKGEEKESHYSCFTEGWKHGGSTELWHCFCASSRGLAPCAVPGHPHAKAAAPTWSWISAQLVNLKAAIRPPAWSCFFFRLNKPSSLSLSS